MLKQNKRSDYVVIITLKIFNITVLGEIRKTEILAVLEELHPVQRPHWVIVFNQIPKSTQGCDDAHSIMYQMGIAFTVIGLQIQFIQALFAQTLWGSSRHFHLFIKLNSKLPDHPQWQWEAEVSWCIRTNPPPPTSHPSTHRPHLAPRLLPSSLLPHTSLLLLQGK